LINYKNHAHAAKFSAPLITLSNLTEKSKEETEAKLQHKQLFIA